MMNTFLYLFSFSLSLIILGGGNPKRNNNIVVQKVILNELSLQYYITVFDNLQKEKYFHNKGNNYFQIIVVK